MAERWHVTQNMTRLHENRLALAHSCELGVAHSW
ncbi:hypothetical protein WCLP8_4230001 [uncultured Gammaproteobacteria bacterium]